MPRYFITIDGEEHEVDKEVWVREERAAGFHNTMGQPNEPATASWSSSKPDDEGGWVTFSGRTESTFEDHIAELESFRF